MKELSIEGKAKAYDELIKRLNKAREDVGGYTFKSVYDEVMSELAESEDERIRKAIKKALQVRCDGSRIISDEPVTLEEAISWLEKQGEQNPVNEDAEKEKYDYVSGQFLYCKGSFNEFKEGESYWLDYIGNDIYVGRSDNILNQKFHITPRQLYTWLDPRHPEDSNKCEQKPAWSVEDETMFRKAIVTIDNVRMDTDFQEYYQGICDWLESLKDRVQLQPKQEWSEEDETVLNNLIYALANDRIGNNRDEYVDWLKSLRPQKQWKPSDEQMVALEHAINCYSDISPTNTEEVYTLEIMKEQLKKLTK